MTPLVSELEEKRLEAKRHVSLSFSAPLPQKQGVRPEKREEVFKGEKQPTGKDTGLSSLFTSWMS
jgi:hypothetical protein